MIATCWRFSSQSALFHLFSAFCHFLFLYHLVGLVVKVSASRAADPGFDSCLSCGDFSGWSHTIDLKTGTPVATLPGTWHYRVSAGTGWPDVSITVTGWGRKFDLLLLSQCGSALNFRSSSNPEIHYYVGCTSKQFVVLPHAVYQWPDGKVFALKVGDWGWLPTYPGQVITVT